MDIFEKASRSKLRFDLNGSITAEELWDFKKEKLAGYEVVLKERIEKFGNKNRFSPSNVTADDELRLKIVSYIIDTKVSEEEESAISIIKKKERQKLLELLERKQNEKLLNLTEEELQAKLKDLE